MRNERDKRPAKDELYDEVVAFFLPALATLVAVKEGHMEEGEGLRIVAQLLQRTLPVRDPILEVILPPVARSMLLMASDDDKGALMAMHNSITQLIKGFLLEAGYAVRRANFPKLLDLLENHLQTSIDPTMKRRLLDLNRLRNLFQHDPISHSLQIRPDWLGDTWEAEFHLIELMGFVDREETKQMADSLERFLAAFWEQKLARRS